MREDEATATLMAVHHSYKPPYPSRYATKPGSSAVEVDPLLQ